MVVNTILHLYLIIRFFWRQGPHLSHFVFWTQHLMLHECLLNCIACPWIETGSLQSLSCPNLSPWTFIVVAMGVDGNNEVENHWIACQSRYCFYQYIKPDSPYYPSEFSAIILYFVFLQWFFSAPEKRQLFFSDNESWSKCHPCKTITTY